MTDRPHIISLAASDLARDPRVARQRSVLHQCGETWSAGLAAPTDKTSFLQLRQRSRTPLRRAQSLWRLLLREHRDYAISRYQLETGRERPARWDLVVANDVDTLPLAFELAGTNTPVLLDAHEYAPREFEDRLYWRTLQGPHKTWLCKTYLPRVGGFTTVCDGIADEYARVFGVSRPIVIPNTPPHQPGTPHATSGDRIRLIHHGLASRSRKIETMIDLMRHLDRRFTLDLMLVPSEKGYLEWLRERAGGDPRITFREPVATAEIISATRDYDIGLFLLPPTNFNYHFALPNKFFEFIQARLAIAIGPSPEMARLVKRHDCGVVADDFSPATLARALNASTPDQIDQWKHHSHLAAGELCWEKTQQVFKSEIERLLALSSCAE